MKLSDLFKELSYNELSNLSLSNEGDGTIIEGKYGKVISAINNSLLDLHSRFQLIEKELIIKSLDWKAIYPLRVEHAVTNTATNGTKWILDSPTHPFTGDLIHVLAVANEAGIELPVNDPNHPASVFFPQPDTIQLTHPGFSQVFFVRYKANHPILNLSGSGVLDQEVSIPLVLKNALRYKTAAQIFSPIGGQEYTGKVQSLEALYESECNAVETNSLLGVNELGTNLKLCWRGFP